VQPSADLVALVDIGLYGRHLSIGSRLIGDHLQWFDGRELHLVRGSLRPGSSKRRSFEFERAGDGQVLKFTALAPGAFEKRFRERFPDAPRDAGAAELAAWLRQNHGLWRSSP